MRWQGRFRELRVEAANRGLSRRATYKSPQSTTRRTAAQACAGVVGREFERRGLGREGRIQFYNVVFGAFHDSEIETSNDLWLGEASALLDWAAAGAPDLDGWLESFDPVEGLAQVLRDIPVEDDTWDRIAQEPYG